ncbi:peroxiredoxin family protein [Bernardetia sp.]|uniref:peroxiredoxin family protein n=1 Tax=Bernardetia sp. TaxID=1937974 RepID=UPI0025C5EB62|nr:TlpA disulfide reductase family protein [Bernardetia sp.]
MKKLTIFLIVLLFSSFSFQEKKIPSYTITTLDGEEKDLKNVLNQNGYSIIVFWKAWSSPDKLELDAINSKYEEWKAETEIKVIAIAISDARRLANAKRVIASKNWQFDIYTDISNEAKSVFNLKNTPHTMIVNKEGEIVKQWTGYIFEDEENYIDFLRNN